VVQVPSALVRGALDQRQAIRKEDRQGRARVVISGRNGAAVDEVPGAGPDVLLATTPALRPGLVRLISPAG